MRMKSMDQGLIQNLGCSTADSNTGSSASITLSADTEGELDYAHNSRQAIAPEKDSVQINTLPDATRQVQRNAESRAALVDMVEPKKGSINVGLIQKIETELENIYTNTIAKSDKALQYGVACLGGIELMPGTYANTENLINDCRLVNVGKGAVGKGIYELLSDDLKRLLVINTLRTMEAASQLDYLKKSDFSGKKNREWKVVVELHYTRNRGRSKNIFHKDTQGKTLFVNLNYMNKKKILGPEYVVNPPPSDSHLEKIAKTMPSEFLQDRKTVISKLKQPTVIKVVDVPAYGYVAFVDEVIHHKTPRKEHRYIKQIDAVHYLTKNNKLFESSGMDPDAKKALYREINIMDPDLSLEKICKNIKKKNKKQKYGLKKEDISQLKPKLEILLKWKREKGKKNRRQLRDLDRKVDLFTDDLIENLLTFAGFNRQEVSEAKIPGETLPVPVTPPGVPLERQLSSRLDKKGSVPSDSEDGIRRFLRTWVTTEPYDKKVEQTWDWTN